MTFQQLGSNGYTPVTLPSGTTFKFGLKQQGQYDGDFVVFCDVWATPAAPATAYALQPSFNTSPLNALLNPAGGDLAQVTLMGEIAWITPGGYETSTRTFSVVIYNDVIKDDEGLPTEGNPAYPTAASLLTTGLTGILPLVVGQSDYAIDLASLHLPGAPRGALFTLLTPTAAESAFGARVVAAGTTAASLALRTDAVPVAAGCSLAYLILP
ncbi:MAG: hypothetical protein PW734_09365 [Verrucomicrobium sp.]|nr:hypothetical protein [Verrucomicrobium sp.]